MTEIHAPPGEVSTIRADRVLVLAPHADDDILGCGGLLAQLADGGAELRVLFLTDSSGGDEVREDRAGYAKRRQEEAGRALAVLGIEHAEHLDIPDGRLAQHIDVASEAISRLLIDFRPELLLSISPLEITSDHQAAFAALHGVLSPLRGDSGLDSAVAELDILLYEINRPAYPDTLVDVSDHLEALTGAIQEHASQLELHNYLEGAIGVRRYRTLSLPPSVDAAEAFRRVAPGDFVSHSRSGLIRALGGMPEIHEVVEGPEISVVVRTKDRPELLKEALASLAAGSYRRVEVVLVNDGGARPPLPEDYAFPIVKVDLEDNRGRAAAANAGIEATDGEYVAFLDDDDLAEPEHLETLAGLVSAPEVRIAYTDAAVGVYELDPEQGWRQVDRRLPYSRDFDAELLLFDNYIPFNTLLIERKLLIEAGPLATELEFFEDWDLLIRLSRLAPFHHHRQVTCEYRHFRSPGHQILGEQASQRADFLDMKALVIERHQDLHSREILARVVARLREEAVIGAGQAEEIRFAHAELVEAYHRVNGERESLGFRAEQLEQQVQAHEEQEMLLREVTADQEDHLKRLYAEITRLNGLISAMESTKAWKLHRTMERLRGRGR
jgi:LmbE family N-acetylglucosaminyl deacetylase